MPARLTDEQRRAQLRATAAQVIVLLGDVDTLSASLTSHDRRKVNDVRAVMAELRDGERD